MEQRMLVVMFNGNNIPDDLVLSVQKMVSNQCFAHPDDIKIYALSENDLAKIIAKDIFKRYSAPESDTLEGDNTIKMLSEKYRLKDKSDLAVALSIDLHNIYNRMIHGKNIEEDNEFINKLKNLITIGMYHESSANKYGYVGDTANIISKVYFKFFDKDGNPLLY